MDNTDSQVKPEEKYPLLKVDGAGDKTLLQPQQSQNRSPCWVKCTFRFPRFSRWPEFISACWMTLILCGISFLIFYALGMGVYRRQQYIIMKCNNTKPASNVFYHYIVPRGHQVPFILYTEYLSYMATQYPLLQFHVLFLVEDSYPDTLRIFRRNLPYYTHSPSRLDDIGKEALVEFQRRYPNVNVTIMPLSKYMATTTLRFRYRLIPTMHLPFYIRAFTVWQNGGIGMDLRTNNNDFLYHRLTDSRINSILKQHNDGIKTEEYTNALKTDTKEENAIFDMLSGLINHFLNGTRAFINKTLTLPKFSAEKILPFQPKDSSLVRTHRAKRDISSVSSENIKVTTVSTLMDKIAPKNDSDIAENLNRTNHQRFDTVNNSTNYNSSMVANDTTMQKEIDLTSSTIRVSINKSEPRQILFYDFMIFSEVGPSYFVESVNQPFLRSDVRKPSLSNQRPKPMNAVSYLLSLDSDGNFIAASSKLHPFLGHLISAGCHRMPPKFAIQDALLSQCSGLLREDVYCNNIFIL